MGLIEKSLELRQDVRRLALGLFRPSILAAEKSRENLNLSLREHWDPNPLEAYELIHENWEPKPKSDTQISNEDSGNFVVFIDPELDIDWITDRSTSSAQLQAISYAESISARRCSHLPREQALEFKRLIGQAVVNAIRDEAKQSRALAEQAAQFLKDRTAERSRFWTLSSAHATLVAFGGALVFALAWPLAYPLLSAPPIEVLVAASGGFLGAYLSILQNAGKGQWDAASGLEIHVFEVLTKLVAGTAFGALIFAVSQSVHAPAAWKALTPDKASLFMFGFAAGFIERIIPKMVTAYSASLTNQELAKAHDTKSNLN